MEKNDRSNPDALNETQGENAASLSNATITEKLKQSKFVKFFEKKIDWREEKKVAWFGKVLMYILIVLTELLLFAGLFSERKDIEHKAFIERLNVLIVACVILTSADAIRLFLAKTSVLKVVCFVLEMIASVAMISVTGSSNLVFLYILILTGFYLGSNKPVDTILVFVVSIPVYIVAYWLTMTIWNGGQEIPYPVVISDSVWALVALVAHFFIVNFALGFYRQYLKLDQAMTELDRNKNELQKAYDSLAEATALEERQRIAKEIHDTAGHSITTVIMQTEAAKLVIDKNPDDAKKKLIAANLQAKHALDELRESVHVLSGNTLRGTLKTELTKVIEESTVGTGIIIRYEIEDVTVSPAKDRLLCNALKEGISNGIRHGKANAFWVELKTENEFVKLLISDNGDGTDILNLKMGFGLSAMSQNAERLGGRIEVDSDVGEGLELSVILPLED